MPDQADADAPSLAEIARRTLDLWEQQVGAMAADPQLASQFAAAASAFLGPLSGGPAAASQAGTASARPASGDGGDALDRLARRIDALEARIAQLESAPKPVRRRRKLDAGGAGSGD